MPPSRVKNGDLSITAELQRSVAVLSVLWRQGVFESKDDFDFIIHLMHGG